MFVLCRKDKGMMFYSPINSSALHVHLSICAKKSSSWLFVHGFMDFFTKRYMK